jgi:hypothetical protein
VPERAGPGPADPSSIVWTYQVRSLYIFKYTYINRYIIMVYTSYVTWCGRTRCERVCVRERETERGLIMFIWHGI